MLEQRGIDPAEIADLVDLAPDDVLLLAGSYATGEANPTSDLDLLVLRATDTAPRPPATSSNHPSIFGDSFDIAVGDLTVNLEYVGARKYDDLCALIDSTVSDLGGPDVANFQPLELRLAQRVMTGVALVGADRLEELRNRLDVSAVHDSAAALNFVMTMSWLEDTRVLSSPSRELMLRGAGESLVLAAINMVGPITYDIKHLFSRAARLAQTPGAPTVLADAERAVFTDRQPLADSVELLLDHAEDMHRIVWSEPAHARIAAMLRPFRPSWLWSGRPFIQGGTR
ncbi:nucleotidyltransferase domain-containing protein [Streptomyces sp. NPDC056704]|uniref:nucleotidyltransferase domain-containing protein n=1 Tax=Streptomyces sp. NPDC056704 TaxID=3345917 RepID=UPI0036CB8A7B